MDLRESEFEQEKKTWKTRTNEYRHKLDKRDEAQKVKGVGWARECKNWTIALRRSQIWKIG